MTNPNYDTCVFLKNPVFQKGAALSPALTPTSNLDSLLIYGVKLAKNDGSPYLQNSSFAIYPSDPTDQSQTQLTRVRANTSGNWKYPFSKNCSGSTCTADSNHYVGQLMAYYWLNQQKDWMIERTGQFYAANQNIQVITFYPGLENAYWDGSNVVMGDGGTTKAEFAMGAEIYLHEMGHANLDFASPGASVATPDCADKQNSCCTSVKGCIGAIHEGQADYHAAIMFPDRGSPIGESYVNSINGFSECGLIRTVSGNKNTTLQQAYDACGSQTRGEVHLMGRVYASVWWEVRNKTGSNPKEVDQLFTEHLKALSGSDTFTSALTKIKATDQALFNSKYSQAFTDEFARRGL
jgi:hypothetical protein